MASTADTTDRGHPIRSAAARIDDILKTVRDAPAWSMSAGRDPGGDGRADPPGGPDRRAAAPGRPHGQTVEVEADSGATTTANWWAHATKQTRAAAHRKTRLAAALGSEAFEPTRVALAEGRLLVDQAQVIVAAVEALPADLDTTDRGGCAGEPGRVRRPPRRPGAADPRQPDPGGRRPGGRRGPRSPAVGREEREAEAAASFRMVEDGHGRCHGRFTISSLHGAMLRKQLLAIAAPETPHPGGRAGPRTRTPVARTGWGRRSRSTSRPTPPTGSRMPVASRPRWW